MRPGEAVMELSRQGFRFRLDGQAVKLRFEGEQNPDPEKISPLLDLLRQHKEDVRYFLKCHCPRCGGCCFIGKWCIACDWDELVEIYPGLKIKH
jgi:hypothetical protein